MLYFFNTDSPHHRHRYLHHNNPLSLPSSYGHHRRRRHMIMIIIIIHYHHYLHELEASLIHCHVGNGHTIISWDLFQSFYQMIYMS